MSCTKIVVLVISVAVGNVIYKLCQSQPVPELPESWWGPGDPSLQDESVFPFKIDVPEKALQDLIFRLKNPRPLTPSLEGVHQHYGINTNLLKEVVDFWINKYDWREREHFLNQLPQYTTNIQGLKIHFLHVKPTNVPKNVKVLPLLLLHGWPGSVREFYEIIPLLTTPHKDENFVFEVIAPSLPGYGFSQAASKPGLSAPNIAVVFKNLMQRLGFKEFYMQGGDWGSAVASYIAIHYPEIVKGIHLNMCLSNHPKGRLKFLLGSLWPSWIVDKNREHKLYPLSNYISNTLLEFGYMHIQATKPDTIGVALNDSPIGLAAYLLEKFTIFTNPEWKNRDDGGLTEKFTYTKLLDNIMIYWFTGSITTSMRLYAESINKETNVFANTFAVQVPAACAVFDNEVLYQPPSIFKDRYPRLVQVNEYSGGHFAAFEVPEVLAADVWMAVSRMEANTNQTET